MRGQFSFGARSTLIQPKAGVLHRQAAGANLKSFFLDKIIRSGSLNRVHVTKMKIKHFFENFQFSTTPYHIMHTFRLFILIGFGLLVQSAVFGQDAPLYKDTTAPLEQRVDDLSGRLTQDEKLALLGGTGF